MIFLRTQKPLPIIYVFQVINRDLVCQCMIPIVFILLLVLKSGLAIVIIWSLPYKIYQSYMIPLWTQHMVWYFLPFRWGLQSQTKNIGMWIYSSIWTLIHPTKHEIQYGIKNLCVLSSNVFTISWYLKYLKVGGGCQRSIYRHDYFAQIEHQQKNLLEIN